MSRVTLWATGLCFVGLIIIVFSAMWITVIEPDFEKLPTDLDETYSIEATVSEIFPSSSETEVVIDRVQTAVAQEDGVLVIREEIVPTPEVPGIIERATLEMGVDRTNREFVSGYGEIERVNLWAYPVGVEKKTYPLWSDTAGRATDAHFAGEEEINGLGVYIFQTDERDLPYGTDPTFGFPVLLDMVIVEKVEPNTGVTVDGESTKTFKVVLPSSMAAMLSEDLQSMLPKDQAPDGEIIIPAVILNQQYSEQTMLQKVADAKDYKTKLLWATKYGLWIGFGCGAIFMLVGFSLIMRSRLARKRSQSIKSSEIQSLLTDGLGQSQQWV